MVLHIIIFGGSRLALVRDLCMGFGKDRTKGKPTVQDLLVVCGCYHRSKYELRAQLEWLERNINNFDLQVLECHYGLLLRGLTITGCGKLMAKILAQITNSNTVTQSRVNRVCDIYETRDHPASVGKLLIAMAQSSGPDIYVPPLGQKKVQDALLPVSTVLQLAYRPGMVSPETFISKSVGINNNIFFDLASPKTEEALEEELATLIPYVEQCGRLPTSIERRIYDYFEYTWLKLHDRQFTAILYMVAAHLFRFWPQKNPSVVKSRLLDVIKQAQPSTAEIIIPHLWHFGVLANSAHTTLLASMISKRAPASSDFTSIRTQSQVFLHYYMYATITSPPPVFVSNLLIQQNVYLFLCAQWASLVPWICSTLQGNFHLLPIGSAAYNLLKWLLGGGTDFALSVIFDVGNSPWVADYPVVIQERAKAEKSANVSDLPLESPMLDDQLKNHISDHKLQKKVEIKVKEVPQTEELAEVTAPSKDAGMSYPEYIQNLANLVANANLDIMPYLISPN